MPAPMRGAAQVRLVLQLFAGVVASWWLLFWFLNVLTDGKEWLNKIADNVYSKFLGTAGDKFMLLSVPIILLVFLGYAALELKKRIKTRTERKRLRTSIWSTPLIIKGPFGILTLLDILIISIVVFLTLWYIVKRSVKQAHRTESQHQGWEKKLERAGVSIGIAVCIPMALLWIPVSRGSPILKLIGIPFESAVRYHIWLGSLTIWLVIFHGGLLIWYYIQVGEANQEGLFSWKVREIAIIPGLIAAFAGVVMLVTALDWVRRTSYDLFFSFHHLYLVFLLFFTFHAPWFLDYMIVPVLLFFLDRFMRMVQSRPNVDVLSAKVLSAGAIELTVANPASSPYDALSFVYVKLDSVSKLMWHPFSVASSPLDGKNTLTIYIKPLGGFTRDFHDLLLTSKQTEHSKTALYKCPFSFKVGLEGPYDSSSTFYLRFKTLVMVAGGIGVTPFLAILKDLVHRHRLQQEDLPDCVHVILCVRNARELHLLDTLNPHTILPGYDEHIKIKVTGYVTSVETKSHKFDISTSSTGQVTMTPTPEKEKRAVSTDSLNDGDVVLYSSSPNAIQEISRFGSAGDTRWVAATVAATLVGFYVSFGTLNLKYKETEDSGPIRTMLYMVCMVIGVVVFGGGVMLAWAFCESRRGSSADSRKVTSVRSPLNQSGAGSPAARKADDVDVECSAADDYAVNRPLWEGNVIFGRRPNWEDTFADLSKQHKGEDVGVMVSGVVQMQQDIARQCRRTAFLDPSSTAFHYHSVSFNF